MQQGARILIIDDDQEILNATSKVLTRDNYAVFTASTGENGVKIFRKESFDMILLDLHLPDLKGDEILRIIRDESPELPVVIITGYATVESAVAAIKAGASDYIPKPFTPDELRVTVSRTLENRKILLENIYLKKELDAKTEHSMILGKSPAMKQVLDMIEIAAPTDSTVLVTGESGTGKEVIAREIHRRSERESKPFVAVDCSTLIDTLFESELFGHVKGSFTGAVATKIGRLELANSGTIFFDEISNLSLNLQAKLLRVIQEREITKVGDTKISKIDVRIISATNMDLSECVKNRTFRDDLFYRLNVIPIKLPALRERKEDIPLLAGHFIRKFSRKIRKHVDSINPDAMKMLINYNWPGNVRELENLIERAIVLAENNVISLQELVFCGIGDDSILSESIKGDFKPLRDLEEDYVRKVLESCGGNISKAAKILEIDRKTLRSKIPHH
jgi:DNA-binding NtrC family response regulator